MGRVFAVDRSLESDDGVVIEHLIQTDAAIIPGHSGGPLLDSAGRLIGINTAISSPSRAYAGSGSAVWLDTVNRVVPKLMAKGRNSPPSIGIGVDEEINLVVTERLDAILRADGRSVDSVCALLAVFDDQPIGAPVILKIWRAGEELEIPVVLQREG